MFDPRSVFTTLFVLAFTASPWAAGESDSPPRGTGAAEAAPADAEASEPVFLLPSGISTRRADLPPPVPGAPPLPLIRAAALPHAALPVPTEVRPRHLPWPPLKASARAELPDAFLRGRPSGSATLADADARLSLALLGAGVPHKTYFAAPQGFAVVTPLERLRDDGTPAPGTGRWAAADDPGGDFTFARYVRALEGAAPGRYRVLAFVVTPRGRTRASPETAAADLWAQDDRNRIPTPVAGTRLSSDHHLTALAYEFDVEPNQPPRPRLPGRLAADIHLKGAGIWRELQRP